MRILCWGPSPVSQSYDPDMGLTYLARTALTAVRVYALYNRNPIVLWVLGTQFALSVIVCLMLVRAFLISRGGRCLTCSTSDGSEYWGMGWCQEDRPQPRDAYLSVRVNSAYFLDLP